MKITVFILSCTLLLTTIHVYYMNNKLNDAYMKIIHLEIKIEHIENDILCYGNKPGMVACGDILENLKKRSLDYNK